MPGSGRAPGGDSEQGGAGGAQQPLHEGDRCPGGRPGEHRDQPHHETGQPRQETGGLVDRWSVQPAGLDMAHLWTKVSGHLERLNTNADYCSE